MDTKCKKCDCKSHCSELEGVRWPNNSCNTCGCEKCDCELCENYKV